MEKQETGVEGLDKLLGGGIPPGNAVLLFAPPGSGKTTLCKRFAATAAGKNSNVAYISTGQPFDEFESDLKAAGCAIDKKKCVFIDCYSWRQPGENPAPSKNVFVMSSITDLNEIMRAVDKGITGLGGVNAIVLDSISDLVLYSTPQSVYKFLQMLQGEVVKNKAAALMALEYGLHEEQVNNTINYIFNGVVEMKSNEGRELRVSRMSGVSHHLKWVKYSIKPKLKIEVNGV